ncbi:MAG: glycosyltransferase family 4 protein [Methylococcales bacterium]|nr:glycosyltransferase family 4 protein [Methylococcales bacterium]MDD5631522.1 glycosyltransferase family 4 protein [Methylococcales bacterium]
MATLLSVNSYFYRRDGSETLFIHHNRLFENGGWQVIPFCMHHPNNPDSPWSKHFVTEIEFGSTYSTWEKVIRVPKVIYSIEARRKLTALIKRVRPDVAHCHSIYHHLSPSILGVLKTYDIPTVMTLHDLKIICPAYHMFNRNGICEKCKGGNIHNVLINRCIKDSLSLSGVVMIESLLHNILGSYLNNIDFFISPCQFYIEKFVCWGWERSKFIHIPNFVDTNSFQPHFNPGKSFIYFGRLSPEKGLLTLIKAAAIAKVPLRLAGDGPQLAQLREEAHATGANVTFLGHLAGNTLQAEIQSARVSVLPSEWYENAPMSILESFALGKPVIGADIGGIPELIMHESTGWTFKSCSVDQLAALMRSVADMPDSTISEMGRAARQSVESEFSAVQYKERITQLYASLGVIL